MQWAHPPPFGNAVELAVGSLSNEEKPFQRGEVLELSQEQKADLALGNPVGVECWQGATERCGSELGGEATNTEP